MCEYNVCVCTRPVSATFPTTDPDPLYFSHSHTLHRAPLFFFILPLHTHIHTHPHTHIPRTILRQLNHNPPTPTTLLLLTHKTHTHAPTLLLLLLTYSQNTHTHTPTQEMVKKGIPNEEATDALVELIKEHGRWVEKSESEEKPKEAVSA